LLRSAKVLVVEDFEPFRQLICSLLRERTEFRLVSESSDGLEAIQKIEELQPDLILLDIGLPSLNGIKVAERARAIAPRAKLLFVSQESSPDVVEETFRVGGHGYVQKTGAQRDLMPAIESVLANKRFVSSDLGLISVDKPNALRRHEIMFCLNDGVLLDGLTSFVATALNAGNAALVCATESHRGILLGRLRTQGVEIDAAIQQGTYISCDVSEAAELDQLLETVTGLREAALRAGKEHPRIAVCGERAGRFWADGEIDEAIRIEKLCNELGPDVDILCVYPAPPSDKEDQNLKAICLLHTTTYSR
jgi:DNA-binding NarL/FixJ family response regulator